MGGLLNALDPTGKPAVIIGSDWGGGIAISMALASRYKSRVGAVVAMYPSYSEVQKDELSNVKARVLLLWSKDDQFHSWSKSGRLLSKKLRDVTVHLASRSDDAAWSHRTRERVIVKFLTGIDFLPQAQRIEEAPTSITTTTAGVNTTAQQNVVFRGEANMPAPGSDDSGGVRRCQREML